MNDQPLVSVIMPAYNAEKYIGEAIQSVLNQDYPHFELLIINDGSTDTSGEIIKSYNDKRIKYFEQQNKGVSAARNVGLDKMSGDYFCFLDADDLYSKESISKRMSVFEKSPKIFFVDGFVQKINITGSEIVGFWKPDFKGNPFKDLILLVGKSFFGNTWMIRREILKNIRFNERLTHGEDLLFYLELARVDYVEYAYTEEPILQYRIHTESAMHGDLKKLELAYKQINNIIFDWNDVPSNLKRGFHKRTLSIMFKSYVRGMQLYRAAKIASQLL